MALPSNVGHGTVTGRFIDSTGAAIEGTVTFTPSPKRLLNATAEPSPVTILPQPVTVTLNDGTFTQQLIATDDPDNNPSGWTYAVRFAFKSVSAAGFDIEVPEDAEIDLTTVSPVSSGNGTTIIAGRGVPAWDDATDGQVIVLVDGEPAWGTVEGSGGGGADLTSYSQVSGLADYPATFPPASHDHSISDVTGLSGALSAKADTTDLDGLATASELTSGLAGKANTSHTHTIANVSGLQSALDGKQPTGDYLTEDDLPAPPDLSGYVTDSELSTALDGKQDAGDYALTSEIPTTPGDIGAQPAGSYATAAQGALADTAVQPAAIADLVTGDGITNIVALTQTEYDQLTPDATTFYVITDD